MQQSKREQATVVYTAEVQPVRITNTWVAAVTLYGPEGRLLLIKQTNLYRQTAVGAALDGTKLANEIFSENGVAEYSRVKVLEAKA